MYTIILYINDNLLKGSAKSREFFWHTFCVLLGKVVFNYVEKI